MIIRYKYAQGGFFIKKTGKSVAFVLALSVIIKLIGFFKGITLASTYGAGMVTDAFNLSSDIVNIFAMIFTSYLGNTFIPIYQQNHMNGKVYSDRYGSNVLHLVLLIGFLLFAVCFAFPQQILHLMAPGFTGDRLALAVYMLRVMSFILPIMPISHVLSNILVSHHFFGGEQIIQLPASIIIILVCLIFGVSHPKFLAYVIPVSGLAQIVILLFLIRKVDYHYQPYFSLRDEHLRRSFFLFLPVMLTTATMEINSIVDKVLSSGLPEGSVAALSYANQLTNVCRGLLIGSLSSVLYPQFTEWAARRDWGSLRNQLFKSIEILLFTILPITVIAFVCARDVVSVVYMRGSFGTDAVLMTRDALMFYILSLPFLSIHVLLVRVFLAYQETKITTISGVAAVTVNILTSIAMVKPLGIAGLALGTTIGNAVSSLILIVFLRKKRGALHIRKTVTQIILMALCAGLCGGVVLLCKTLLVSTNTYIRFGLCAAVGGGIYLVLTFLFRIRAFTWIQRYVWEMLMSLIRRIQKASKKNKV